MTADLCKNFQPPASLDLKADVKQTDNTYCRATCTAKNCHGLIAIQVLAAGMAPFLRGSPPQENLPSALTVCLGQAKRAVKILPVHGSQITNNTTSDLRHLLFLLPTS